MKRALLILLTLAMLASMIVVAPVSASAAGETPAIGKVAADYEPEGKAITSADDFAAMDADGKYYLAKDITVSATYTTNFIGTFDGNGKTITTTVAPLFSEFNGTLKNLTVAGDVTITKSYTGVIANLGATTNNVTISNVVNKVNLTGNFVMAGFIAKLNNAATTYVTTFENCVNDGVLSGGSDGDTTDSAGFVGRIQVNAAKEDPVTIFKNCVNNANLTLKGRVGGIVAYTDASIRLENCENNGDIIVNNAKAIIAGGIAGRLGGGKTKSIVLENCKNNGDVKLTTSTTSAIHIGGVVGFVTNATNATFNNCVNSGKVDLAGGDTKSGSNLGGILGSNHTDLTNLTFEGCVNNGAIASSSNLSGYINAGGIVGYTPTVAGGLQTYTNCINNGFVNAYSTSSIGGGIVGRCYPSGNGGYIFDGCINNGNVEAYYVGGGIAGAAGYDSKQDGLSSYQFLRCGNTAKVSTKGNVAGGIVGHVQVSTKAVVIKYCFNTGEVYSPSRFAGGIFGGDRDAGDPYLLNVRFMDIEYCYVSGNISTGRTVSPKAIESGATVGRLAVYSYTGATGTRIFYGPQTGTVEINGDKVIWTSTQLKVPTNTVADGTKVTADGTYKVTIGQKNYIVYLKANETFTIVDENAPVFAIDGKKVAACELTGNADGYLVRELDTYAEDEFTPYAAAIGFVYVGTGYAGNNYVVEGAACADYVSGAYATIFGYDCSNAVRLPKVDLESGKLAYELNQAIGKETFYQVIGKDAAPTTHKTEGSTVYKNVYCDGSVYNYSNTELDTQHKNNEHGYCDLCQVKISGASISVGKDLTVNYSVNVISDELKAQLGQLSMKFTMNEKSVTVALDEAKKDADGHYVFSFQGIAPQCMTDNIKAELVLGETVIASKDEYSVKANAEALLDLYADDEELVQFVVDMLHYGAAAQNYKKYNLENLATAGIEGNASTATPAASDTLITNAEGAVIGDVYFKSANVWFDNVNKIGIRLNAVTENTKIVVKKGDEVIATYTSLSSGINYTDAIYATGLCDVYTFELYEGETLLQTLKYSVSSYVFAKMNEKAENSEELSDQAKLVRALYNYGKSATAYVAAQK